MTTRTRCLSVLLFCASGAFATLVGAYPGPPCNNKQVTPPAPNEKCGSPTPCSAYSGTGSCTGFTQNQTPLRDYCGTGPTSTYCVESGTLYHCTYTAACVWGTIPNPNHDPDDPNSPVTIDVCQAGSNIALSSTKNVAVASACSDQT